MSEKRGPPPSAAFPGATAGVSYPQMIPPQNPPPSYVESLNHQVVAGNPGIPQYQPYVSQATAAAATAAQLQSFKDKDPASLAYYQNLAAAQQAQKLAYSQQAAYQQQQQSLYVQQQQQLYLQQLQGYYPPPPQAPPFQHGQNVLVLNGFESGARFDGIAQPSIPPPPPGVAPNAAQLAAASGAQVSMSQKKGSFLSGGSGGGFTFW
ncbi:YLP motif-containing protein 1 isoform X1 [Penaeus vannamei]|uniref:YLP motif-containing protein 1 isoform X1 n=2 Tax=Penaeus vannamei TaxID=6689 RepID=UPI000F68EAB0|nr:glutenin, low molecular weight subunit-like [Penaeus vannamei]